LQTNETRATVQHSNNVQNLGLLRNSDPVPVEIQPFLKIRLESGSGRNWPDFPIQSDFKKVLLLSDNEFAFLKYNSKRITDNRCQKSTSDLNVCDVCD